LAVDRWLKALVLAMGSGTPARGWPVEFDLFLNRGIAFSLPLPPLAYWPLAAIALGFLIWVLVSGLRERDHWRTAWVIAILAGAASNLFDRLVFGATVDYLIFFDISALNLADVLIVAGIVALLVNLSRRPKDAPATKP
jgi:lipoprotein signal peptidase